MTREGWGSLRVQKRRCGAAFQTLKPGAAKAGCVQPCGSAGQSLGMAMSMSPAAACCAGAAWLARVTAACGAAAGGMGSGPLAQQRLFSAYVHVGSNEQGFKGAPAWPDKKYVAGCAHGLDCGNLSLCCFCFQCVIAYVAQHAGHYLSLSAHMVHLSLFRRANDSQVGKAYRPKGVPELLLILIESWEQS